MEFVEEDPVPPPPHMSLRLHYLSFLVVWIFSALSSTGRNIPSNLLTLFRLVFSMLGLMVEALVDNDSH